MRQAEVSRNTLETQITVRLNLDGSGCAKLNSGIPFLDHMLDQIARHGLIDLEVEAKGDLVRAELKKYAPAMITEKLDMLGRLLGAVRLLDMMLSDDGQVNWYVEEFFKGNYSFSRGQ